MYKFALNGISENLSTLAHNLKYGTINTAGPNTMVSNVVKLLSEPYMLQDD